MKKRLIIFLTVLALSACLFAITASAEGVYEDFTKPGVNGEAPIFSFLGYSADENEGNICVTYMVDKGALEAYEKAIGKSLNYGVVIGYKDYIENGKPLNKNGKPTGPNANKILAIKMEDVECAISVKIMGLTVELFDEELALGLYVVENGAVKYVLKESSSEITEHVSYKKARGPLIATVNGMTYSTEGETELSWDRIRQMKESAAAYNTTTMTDSEANDIISKSNLIIAGGNLIGWNNAAKFLQHFHDGTGTQYNVDMKSFLSDTNTKNFRNEDIDRALRAGELIAREGEYLTVNQEIENLHKPSGDWYYAVGSYFSDVDLINLTVTVDENGVKHYSADIRYIMTDFYNWDKNNTWPVINKTFWFITITGPSPAELFRLHAAGRAQEFLTYGEITYENVTWTEGQTVDKLGI